MNIQLKKSLHHLTFVINNTIRIVTKQLKSMDIYEKVIVIGVAFVMMLLIVSPMIVISSNVSIEQGPDYSLFIMQPSLWKSLLLMIASLGAILMRFFHHKFKIYIIEKLGFQGNNFLFVMILLLIALSSFTGIGDVIALLNGYTKTLNITWFYYIALIVLVVLFFLCIYSTFYIRNKYFKGHVVGYYGRKEEQQGATTDGSLFDQLEHDE